MKKILKYIMLSVVLLSLVGGFSACERKEKEIIETRHVGKWKLEKIEKDALNFDYSQHNIVYEFKTNNILIVSGDIDSIEDYRGHEIGEYFYKIPKTVVCPTCLPPPCRLEINGAFYDYFIDGSGLPFSDSPKPPKEMMFEECSYNTYFFYFIKLN
jgi:hypothetical protein